MKYTVVKPLFKKGYKSNIFNYRLISILGTFSKVFEKVMHIQLQEHFNKHSILAEELYGFRNDSTTKLYYKLIKEILNAISSKFVIDAIFWTMRRLLTV
jgi:hypothetical protein